MTDSMDAVGADFTPNPDRAIWIQGELRQALLDRLEPKIVALTAQSRDPITVFIDSPGGSAAVGERVLRLLRSTDQHEASACRIITVAISRAKSAAADLLSAGDFAIAHPGSTLLYHGTRTPMTDPVTGEWATALAEGLTISNERYAAAMARRSAQRFLFIASALRASFAQHRAEANDSTLTDINCFLAILRAKLSPSAQQVLEKAITRWDSYKGLLAQFQKTIRRARASNGGDLQKLMHSASIAFEYQSNRSNPTWSLSSGGLSRIRNHFSLLDAYFGNLNGDEFGKLRASLDEPHKAATNGESSYFLLCRSFFFALCRALQEGDNELTAMDALYLGLIDTVRADLTAP